MCQHLDIVSALRVLGVGVRHVVRLGVTGQIEMEAEKQGGWRVREGSHLGLGM